MPRTLAFFNGSGGDKGQELWETDGTAAGTALAADIIPGVTGSSPGKDNGAGNAFVAAGAGAVVFAAQDGGTRGAELFVSNGTAAGTVELSNAFFNVSSSLQHFSIAFSETLGGFVPLGDGRVLFSGSAAHSPQQLWVTDGTATGTAPISNVPNAYPPYSQIYITSIGRGRAVFQVGSSNYSTFSGVSGTDGTTAGTVLLSSNAALVGGLGDGRALLKTSNPDNTVTLGITDGTVAGTAAIRSFTVVVGDTPIGDGRALLSAADGLAGVGLWVTDGTAAGTVKLLQGVAANPSNQGGLAPENITALGNGQFVFTGNDGTAAVSVFVTDATAAGTAKLAEFSPPGNTRYTVVSVTSLRNGRALIQVVDLNTNNSALLVTDGTSGGTGIAHSFTPAQTSTPGYAAPALTRTDISVLPNGTAVFTVRDGTLWRTDGTAAGTFQIAAMAPAGYYGTYDPGFTILPDGRALFRAYNGNGGYTLWATGGTAASTAAIPGVSVTDNIAGIFGLATVPDLDPLFDTDYYNARNPDVVVAGLNAYQHFQSNGGTEGRSPDPFFDSALYLRQNPDVAASGINPLTHFEQFGWHEGRDPSLLFSVSKYLAANQDVAAAGIDPLEHYLRNGQAEGRATFLSGGVKSVDPLVSATFYDAQLGATLLPPGGGAAQQAAYSYDATGWQRGLNPDAFFNTAYYLAHNADVAAAHVNPLLQYEQFGWKEGRDPSAAFSTNKYLAANPDVRAAGIDPLLHYVQYGQSEGRAIYPA